MGISLFSKGNERLMQGLNYDSFTSLARSADDEIRKGGAIGDRTIRLTKNGKGIATTKIPKGEKAWDMKSNMYENGHMERRTVKVEDLDFWSGKKLVDEELDAMFILLIMQRI